MLRLDLEGGRHLRLLEESDAQELHALVERNRERLARWMVWAEHQTLQQTLMFIQATRRQIAENDGLTMALAGDEQIIGVVGFHGVDWQHRSTSLGYWLTESEEGRGTMTRAVAALVGHAFERWRLNRVEIRADVSNTRSRAVAERLGFRQEGTLREAYRVGGRYGDDVVYSMLASDWRA
jgi:ribosomal-protein-serine acetyltransferase